ncbi:fimbria/pilus outer membrane usher protein [Erwinia sp. B116]|uniref:fimbria/pilus outer membrane usher protein n=1 Tax=Erwinia sp. B116 TaxID=1561024 RepID=UPI000C78E7F3|nr:fimbria/pilus outer membrane usher protein [Erwinia sp. B116]PLV61037.1 fimbrial assembly protein [Erwinia sp. B116]
MKNNKQNNNLQLRVSQVACFVAAQLALSTGVVTQAQAQERDYFNPALLELGAPNERPVDLSAFETQGGQLPGTYNVEIYLNDQKMESRDVEFRMGKDASGKEMLLPCLPVDTLQSWGVITSAFPDLGAPGSECANISAIPQAFSDFRFGRQQLLLSFPQSAVNNSARGWVDPASWDQGIPAFLLNYSATGSNNSARKGEGKNSESQFINLRPGINVGPWRVRNYTTWSRSNKNGQENASESSWETVYTYAQRDIIALKSQFKAGDSSTPSDVFDSISYRGLELGSDDDMLPDSLKGYAPVVRGIARSNAKVTIRQNGFVIYENYVSPGAFEITDMYPTGGSGDLNVTITESDGSEQHQVIPFASLPVLQREGRLKYGITSGVYRTYDNGVEQTPLTQATAIYGLPKGFTLYGGGQFSSHYKSLALGVGKNLGDFGAVSADVTHAWSTMKDQTPENGQSWRMRYSKNFAETGTNFTIAGYRYATEGFWGLQEVLDTWRDTGYSPLSERRRNRAELTMSQQLGDTAGSVSLSALREDYYNAGKTLESYGVGYNSAWNSISYGINYSYNRNAYSSTNGKSYDEDQLLSVNVSIPFSVFGPKDSSTYAGYMLNTSKKGKTSQSVSMSGTTLEQKNLSWSVQEGYTSGGLGNSGSVNANLRGTYGDVNGGYSYDQNNQRLNYGVSGGLIVHQNGVTLGQPLGETIALVAAPDAAGIAVQGQMGVKTDARGYAIVPYASPYRKNEITLDTQSFGDEVEVAITNQTVIPTRGAVVRANYQTSVGYRVLMNLTRAGSSPVPFGAVVTNKASKTGDGYIVGEQGQVFLTGMAQHGNLLVKWGNGADEQCQVNYNLPDKPQGITNIDAQCH